MQRCAWSLLLAAALSSCDDGRKAIEKRQKAVEDSRAALKAEQDKKEKPAAVEAVKLEPFWDDPAYEKLVSDGACPEGIWALYNLGVPGEAAEKKANAKQKPELAKKLKEKTFLVKFRSPLGVKLGEYDAPKGQFPLEVQGSLDCSDSFGHVTIAWTRAQAKDPGASAAKQGAEVTQNVWMAEPLRHVIPMKSMSDAKEYKEKRQLDLQARLVLRFGKTQVDKKLFKVGKVADQGVSYGGGTEDWGAGRLVQAELVGLRISTDREKTVVHEKR